MEALSSTKFFEQHSRHCPLLTAANRLRLSTSQKSWQLLLFVIFVCFVYNCYQHFDWVEDVMQRGQIQGMDQPQPSDGGLGGQSSGGGYSNEKSSEGGGGSRDPPQAPSSRGGSSSSSGGDNGGDDPNKKRPINNEPLDATEVESKEEEGENIEDNDDSQTRISHKDQMVTNQLQQQLPANQMPFSGMRHIPQGTSVMPSGLCSNPWMSSSAAAVKSFVPAEPLNICQLEEKEVIHEATDEEPHSQQAPQSAASVGEEQLNFGLSSVTATEGILEKLSFYTTIEIESFSGPRSDPHFGEEVSTESIQALHANTYHDLAHLQIVQDQVLQAAEATEPFDYTLAMVMYHHGNQLLIPCLPDKEFDPTDDVHVVAVPADCIVSEFIVHVNPYLRHVQ